MNMAHFANRMWYGANLIRWRRFREALKSPLSAQVRILQSYVKRNADTLFGRKHGFSSVRSIQDFQKAVPLTTYEDYVPFIDSIGRGASDQTTADRVSRLMPTSGSSGAIKFIPYTNRLQAEFNRAIGPWIVDLFKRFPSAMDGPAYWAVSPAICHSGETGWTVPVGFEDDTKYLGACLSRLVGQTLAVPTGVRHIQEISLFKFITLAFLLAHRNLSFVSIWHPSYLSVLLADLAAHLDTIIGCLQDGRLRLPHDLDGSILPEIHSAWKRDRSRAKELAGIDVRQWNALWPKLSVISSWGHGASQLPWTESARAFPSTVHQPKGLIATEAIMTIPFRNRFPLAINSHFFEFIDDTGRILTCDQLKVGSEYEIAITTGGGLYRYRIGDRVSVNGFVASTPSLVFVGRGALVSDICGEKLSEAFVAKCINKALAGTLKGKVNSARLIPERRKGVVGYCLKIHLKAPLNGETALIERRVEIALKKNPHYALCVRLGQLAPLRVEACRFPRCENDTAISKKPCIFGEY
ncbi:MAG: GH3 auxin-responsive promoter family protein [Phycisphaerales bacterium]|nr:GH3 auxin-responsive promoter family protein [Phycisphaerales bacterium]